MTTKAAQPTAGAMRAARAIFVSPYAFGGDNPSRTLVEYAAELIDRETHAAELLEALEGIICPDCDHRLGLHADQYGCEFERGDREGNEGEPSQAMGPCSCKGEDIVRYPDIQAAIAAIRKAKGTP